MNDSKLPRFPEPYWRTTAELPAFSKLQEDLRTDVAIIGGGITGLTSAYLLAKAGAKVSVIEAGSILNGTTGHTTAKVTAQHGLIYDELISHFGEDHARLYYQANFAAMQFVKQLVKEQQIDCDFSEEDAYLYTNSDKEMAKLLSEFKAYEKLGVEGSEYVSKLPVPVDAMAAIVMRNQAQFHPLKFLKHLVDRFTEMGGQIYEHTTAVDLEEGSEPVVTTRDGHKVHCNQLIISTHFPFYDLKGFYFARMQVHRSYVLAVKTEKEFPGGMYINAETPTRSLRSTDWNGEKLVLFGGDSHITGQDDNTHQYYEALEAFAAETFGVKDIPFRWSAQDPTTLDKIPYVGKYSSSTDNIFVATGYRKWGMSNGIQAALLMTDLVLRKENPYEDVFEPQRFHSKPDVAAFVADNALVAKELMKGKLDRPSTNPEGLGQEEGAVVTVNGKRAGAYRDENGQLHVVDTTCTHMGCELNWNNGDRTWDCPCHGSRFSYKGDVIDGPAELPLEKVDLE
ncbi:FAD-dependent oxidoreductase [Mesobacillus subterraneus]|uniref:(2Fe-2S)-binding protein n=1 Tax=Mesobacillus subterraneus TaxID=285983 RepID=A0A0D6ZAD6_9BACI|nr:FAD-dependent oxidoreductase [Mesobacillus subterraneus]KIY22016.1 (2Fe-2S)-binding protein [Mesobacillus subterraneus]